MIGMHTTVVDNTAAVKKAADKASYRNLGHAAASLRKAAMKSIKTHKGPAEEGEPPHSRRGQLRRAILFDVPRDKLSAIVGPVESRVGLAGAAQEFGGEYKGQDFPERPFMGPALEDQAGRMLSNWEHSVGAT